MLKNAPVSPKSAFSFSRKSSRWRNALGIVGLGFVFSSTAFALEKAGMPDLAQVDNTCLPTSTANLLIWFGHHGYPKLILPGATEDERESHSIHLLMADTVARYDMGTQMIHVAKGIEKYIEDAGYDCDVEFRGLGGKEAFTRDWLNQNDDPNKGFILILVYCGYDRSSQTFFSTYGVGHAVTLVNAEDNMLLIHDPGHLDDEPGRKIVTAEEIPSGHWMQQGESLSVAGLLLLSGSLLEAPPQSGVMVMGAVCITMHPIHNSKDSSSPILASTRLGGTNDPSSTPVSPGGTSPSSQSWVSWIFDLFFHK